MSPHPLPIEERACLGTAFTDFTIAFAESEDGHARPVSIANNQPCFPPSVVLGELGGEPASVDFCGPPSLRGSGLAWPSSARIDPVAGSARFPISLAWPLLDYRIHATWKWRVSGEHTTSCEPADAIASVMQTGLALANASADVRDLTIVVPNTIGVEAQDRLLRAISLRHIDAQLLWRPIAAALTWITEHGTAILEERSANSCDAYTPLGLLWVIHLGLDAFEATQLELIPWEHLGKHLLLPARRLPSLPTLYGAGLEWTEWLAEQVQNANGDIPGAVWNLMWTTNWFEQVIGHLGRRSNNAFVAGPSLMLHDPGVIGRGIARAATLSDRFIKARTQLNSPPPSGTRSRRGFAALDGPFAQEKLGRSIVSTSFDKWVGELRRLARTDLPVLGIVGTGAFAGLSCNDATVCEFLVRLVGTAETTPRSIIDSTSAILSNGAAIYAEHCRSATPAYLDVIPQLELLIVRSGEPVFEDILRIEAPYVLGGQEQVFEPTDLGLHVRQELAESELKLSVWQEGHETVREVRILFPRPIPRDTPVRLEIRMTPGQGNPRVEIKPNDLSVFGGRRVYLDWKRADDTGLTREEALEQVERTNPPLAPRLASLSSWRSAKHVIERFLNDVRKLRTDALGQQLEEVKQVLRQNDLDYVKQPVPEHATAVSSEGHTHPAASDTSLLPKLIKLLDELLDKPQHRRLESEIIRVLGYCSARSPTLITLLRSVLRESHRIKDHHLLAIGNCFREPKHIRDFAYKMLDSLNSRPPRAPNDWMRAMCRLLQYREGSAELFDSTLCLKLSEKCLDIMKEQIDKGGAKYLYRHASLCVVYLLRRRRYDDAYLDPHGELAEEIKSTFRLAIRRFKSGRLDAIGGFVDLPHVTQMMIDYIDRRGRGRLVGLPID